VDSFFKAQAQVQLELTFKAPTTPRRRRVFENGPSVGDVAGVASWGDS